MAKTRIESVSELLTLEEAAERSGLSVSGLRFLRSTGEGPAAIRMGKRVYIEPAELKRWLNERAKASA